MKIMAFTASVEAAKPGHYSRGIAVPAEWARKMSESIQAPADTIKSVNDEIATLPDNIYESIGRFS